MYTDTPPPSHSGRTETLPITKREPQQLGDVHALSHPELYLLGLSWLHLCTEPPKCSLYQRRKSLGDMAYVMYEVKLELCVKPILQDWSLIKQWMGEGCGEEH